MLHGAHQQAGDDEQNAACGHLRADQDLPGDGPLMPLTRELKSRREAEEQRRGHRHAHGKEDDPPVRGGGHPFRRVGDDVHHADGGAGKRQPGGGAENREQKAFRKELAEDAFTAGADGQANADLVFADDPARQQEPAQVGAGHRQDEQRKRGKDLQSLGHARIQRDYPRAGVRMNVLSIPDIFRNQLSPFVGQAQQLRLGGFGSRAGSEPPPDFDRAAGGIGEEFAAFNDGWLLGNRHPNIRLRDVETGKLFRHDADDSDWLVVDPHHSSNDGGIGGEVSLPKAIAEHGDGRCGGGLVERGLE